MEILKQNAKAAAGAIAFLLVSFLRPYFPDIVADPAFQSSIESLISLAIVMGAVWVVPNKPKDTPSES